MVIYESEVRTVVDEKETLQRIKKALYQKVETMIEGFENYPPHAQSHILDMLKKISEIKE